MSGYTARATAVAGRAGHVESNDKVVNFDLSLPKELGGPGKPGSSNPEQLFAAGYAACFGGAMGVAAGEQKLKADNASVTAEVTIDKNDSGFFLAAKLHAKIPGVDKATTEKIMHRAHEICPYSKATRGNIKVELVAE